MSLEFEEAINSILFPTTLHKLILAMIAIDWNYEQAMKSRVFSVLAVVNAQHRQTVLLLRKLEQLTP